MISSVLWGRGFHVRKGERGRIVVKYGTYQKEDKQRRAERMRKRNAI